MKWLVTCFEPFGGALENSSMKILEPIRNLDWQGRVEFLPPLPVEFERSWDVLSSALASSAVGGVLALGQAEGRQRLSLERVAHNWIQTAIADNAQVKPQSQRIDDAGTDLRWSPIPWSKMPPTQDYEISYSAGRYVCNELLYHLLGWAEQKGIYAGFVHVPLLPGEVTAVHPMVESLKAVLHFSLNLKKRIRVVAGVIENTRGQVLIARRPEGKHLAGLWEFPGGKIESGEHPEAAVHRELKEELNLDVTIKSELGEFDFEYEWGALGLRVFVVQAESAPQPTNEVKEFEWLYPDQVNPGTLMPADIEPLNTYLRSRT